jgi:hypothetical protein
LLLMMGTLKERERETIVQYEEKVEGDLLRAIQPRSKYYLSGLVASGVDAGAGVR